MNDVKIESSWKEQIIDEFSADYMKSLGDFLRDEKRKRKNILPPGHQIFNAFEQTKFHDVKVVILGQDPYHGPGQAHGLSFSVEHGIKPPPSLQNIYKELQSDIGISIPSHGNLTKWANQGVLLLNSILTVERGRPGSHANLGWEIFTDRILTVLNTKKKNVVYILWGKKAQDKCEFIDDSQNLIIKSPHPSPYSANSGFFGSRPFSKANEYLKSYKVDPIKWNL
tara:strand:- start:32685 stop:33359 length:675 start_codon:yes stop_codon:yes gene_type:complete